MAITHLTMNNFESLTSSGTVIIDFWASWCGPCLMQAPILEQFDREMNGAVKICKVDVDEESFLAAKFGIASIPTLALMRDGKLENISVGLHSLDQLRQLVK